MRRVGQAAEDKYTRKMKQWEINEARRVKRIAGGKCLADGSAEKPAPKPSKLHMQQADADNFFEPCGRSQNPPRALCGS